MADDNSGSTLKLTPLVMVISIIISVLALIWAMQADRKANQALDKLETHHHSSTSSGTELKEKPSDTGQPNLMRGTGQPPTQ